MSVQDKAGLAEAFGIHPELVPFLPVLLGDLWSLGVPTDVIIDLLRPLNLPANSTKVLDLGCGKGAVAIDLARELGFSVTGIDFYRPFIEEARIRTAEMGMDRVCRFIHGDIRDTVKTTADFDVVTLVWVGSALGDLKKTVGALRRQVVPGGYMVIADGYLKEGAVADVGHREHAGHKESIRLLTAHGDIILQEVRIPADRIGLLYGDYLNSLQRGARKITRENPELKEHLYEHVKTQERMCATMQAAVVPAVWLITKEPGS
jgi:ubiquinone/menaquinone biosynthesis C-methylase UbiE